MFEFTYIGNLPKNFEFINSTHLSPLSGLSLANEIKQHNIYITGSINEPSGNHHIEAAQCGLPLMYIDSGGIPEYCEGFGSEFNLENIEEILLNMIKNYQSKFENMKNYSRNSLYMSLEYEELFLELFKNKKEIVASRDIKLVDSRLARIKYTLFN